jgi:hypothetical protein
MDELPTYKNMCRNYPKTFGNNENCFDCGCSESNDHWIECGRSIDIKDIIENSIKKKIKEEHVGLSSKETEVLKERIAKHEAFQSYHPNNAKGCREMTLKGLIPRNLITTFGELGVPAKEATKTLLGVLNEINDEIYSKIWKPYCTKLAEWKLSKGIKKINYDKLRKEDSERHKRNKNGNNKRNRQDNVIMKKRRQASAVLCTKCKEPLQHHDEDGCPPIGVAKRKYWEWCPRWAKRSESIGSILKVHNKTFR